MVSVFLCLYSISISHGKMNKDNAPVIGGAGGGVFAWFKGTLLQTVPGPFLGKMFEVAVYAMIGAAVGEAIKLGFSYLKKWIDKKRDSDA